MTSGLEIKSLNITLPDGVKELQESSENNIRVARGVDNTFLAVLAGDCCIDVDWGREASVGRVEAVRQEVGGQRRAC